MASYTGLMGGSQLSIIGTHVSGMLANPMSIPPSISGANQTSQAATIYTYGAYGSIICICGPITSPGTTLSGTLPPNSPPCHPSPPTPPAACPTTSQHSPVGHPPCIARAISANHFLYDSQYLDTVSGLYYLRARWYDPATGQFISVDALVGITDQPYEYAGSDPVNLTDLLGLLCLSIHCIFNDISSVAGAASAVTALIPGLEGVSEMAGIIAFATKLVSCVTGHCNYAVLALDVLALIPGGAALKFANQADRDEAELTALRAASKVDPSLESDLGYQKLLDKLSGYTSSALSTISLIPTRGRSHHYNHSHCIG